MYAVSTALRNALDAGKPQRILLAFGSTTTFSNEDIAITDGVTYTEMFTSQDDICIGSCPSSEISFTLFNDVGQLDNFQFGKFTAYLGARIDSGTPTEMTKTFTEGGVSKTYAFTPLGVFSADRPDIIKKAKIAVTANDQMVLFDVDMPSKTALNITYPITLGSLLAAMCTYLNVTLTTTTFTNSTMSVAAEPDQFKSATMRDVLSWIAEAACGIAHFNRNGGLSISWYNTVNKTFSESGYSEFTPAWFETAAITGTFIKNGNSNATLSLGTDSNQYIIQNNPFLRQSDANNRGGGLRDANTPEQNINAALTAAPQYHPYSASLFTDWTLEAGDVVTVTSGTDSYSAPIHNMTLKWFGAPKLDISAAGNPKREVQDESTRKEYASENQAYNNRKLVLEAEEQIVLKVSKGDVSTQLSIECGNVSVSGGNLVVSGYIKASELASEIANISDVTMQTMYATAADITTLEANYVSAATGVIDTFSSDDITAAALTVGGTAVDPTGLVASIGPATVDSNTGGVSIPWAYADGSNGTPITFNVADTVYFQQAVAAAEAAVTVSGSWATNMFTATASNGNGAVGTFSVGDITSTTINPNDGHYLTGTVPVTLVGGGSSSYTPTVNINATPAYNAGQTAGQSSVTVSGSWANNMFTASASNGQGAVGSFTVGDITSTTVNPNDGRYLTGTVPITLAGGGSTSYSPTININATPAYSAGVTQGEANKAPSSWWAGSSSFSLRNQATRTFSTNITCQRADGTQVRWNYQFTVTAGD